MGHGGRAGERAGASRRSKVRTDKVSRSAEGMEALLLSGFLGLFFMPFFSFSFSFFLQFLRRDGRFLQVWLWLCCGPVDGPNLGPVVFLKEHLGHSLLSIF